MPGLVLGLDPGVTTGTALWDPAAGALLDLSSAPVLDVIAAAYARDEGESALPADLALVVVEDNRGVGIYGRHAAVRGPRRDAIARDVGRVEMCADLIAAAYREAGHPVVTRPPRGKKWDAETLARLTGWADRSNEHGRDAARLVVGLTERNVRDLIAEARPPA